MVKMEEVANQQTFKSYVFFWTGQLFSLLGSSIVQFVLIVWITIETGSLLMLSLANFFFVFPILIITPIAGVFADRYDRKKLILIVDSIQAFLTVVLIGFFLFNFVSIAVIFSIIFFRSACQAFHSPTALAITPSMVPQEELGRMNGINHLFTGLISIIGYPVGATLLLFFQLEYILWVDVITFLIAVIPLILIKIPKVNIQLDQPKDNGFLKDFKVGLKVMRAIPGLLVLMLIAMVVNFFLQPLFVLMPFYILNKHGGNVFILGLMEMIIPATSLIGSLVPTIKKTWNNKMRVMFIGLIITNIGYLAYALAPTGSFLIISLGAILIGFVNPIINILAMTIFQTIIPKDKIGRVVSIILMLSMMISPLGAILSGPLSLVLGLTGLYLVCAILGIILAVLSYFFTNIRHIDYEKEFELDV
jgi:DHA3 family macrolide efflux protein-like MFS transporter